MANIPDTQDLLRQAVELARAGKNDQAKALLTQVTELDQSNERAWMLLATLSNDDNERKVYLGNVLYINADNAKAREMLERIEGNAKGKPKPDELMPGVPRQRLYLYIGGAVGVWLLLMIILIFVGNGRRDSYYGEQTRLAQAGTDAVNTQVAGGIQAETQVAVDTADAATLIATLATATPENFIPTRDTTNSGQPTLPPTWTPVPSPTDDLFVERTPFYPPPPPESFAGNVLVGWGGQDINNIGFYPLQIWQLGQGTPPIEMPGTTSSIVVRDANVSPAGGGRLTYMRWFFSTLDFGLETANINGTQPQLLLEVWGGNPFILKSQSPEYSYDGTKLAFIGQASDNGKNEVWVLDLVAPPAQNPLTRVTNGAADYLSVAISPDGTYVAAIKIETNSINPFEDLVLIEVGSGRQTPITNDSGAQIEQQVRWIGNTSEIAYVVSATNAENPSDIIRINALQQGIPPLYIIRTPEIDEYDPVFSPDGQWMAYTSDEAGGANIFIQNLQTQEKFQLTNEAIDPYYPGGWFQPDVVAPIPAGPQATFVPVEQSN
ncbi:MAG: hypothetical protein ACOYL5_11735 [Phototrophicaceae bacterium]